MLNKTIFIFMLLYALINAFEKSDKLCELRCSCNIEANAYMINCDNKSMIAVIGDWPEVTNNITEIRAIFNSNNLTTLEPLPRTELDLIVSFSNNNIKELRPELFANCANITFLDLSHNQIPGDQLHTDVFKGQYNNTIFEPIALQELDLSYNQIHSLTRNLFEHMPFLKRLNLEGNHFRILDINTLNAFAKLTNVLHLNLANNRLIYMPNATLIAMVKLKSLDLSENALDFVPVAIKTVTKTLTHFSIDNNPIIDITNETFSGMEHLVQLTASNLSHLETLEKYAFQPLKNLQTIDLSHLGLNAIDHELFDSSQNIKELNLSYSALNSLPPNLLNWSTLEILDLNGNEFYCMCTFNIISAKLSPKIKEEKNVPYCIHYRKLKKFPIYSMDECFDSDKLEQWLNPNVNTERKIMRITLVLLVMVLIVVGATVMWIGYMKYNRYRRNRSYPFATPTVLYNPIINS